jgi:hypothetical protein
VIALESDLDTPDATSGFRAISREAPWRTLVFSNYSYILETLIQAGAHDIAVEHMPVWTNPPTRPACLMLNLCHCITSRIENILRSYTMDRPLRAFSTLSLLMILGAAWLLESDISISFSMGWEAVISNTSFWRQCCGSWDSRFS